MDVTILHLKYYNLKYEYFLNFNIEDLMYGLTLAIKSFIMIFIFIWVRASFPRIRFDQLMSYCWTVLLPIVFAFIVLMPCIIYVFRIIPSNVLLF